MYSIKVYGFLISLLSSGDWKHSKQGVRSEEKSGDRHRITAGQGEETKSLTQDRIKIKPGTCIYNYAVTFSAFFFSFFLPCIISIKLRIIIIICIQQL